MKRESGIFLVEAMASLLLLGVAAVVVSQSFPASGRVERTAREAFVSSLRLRSLLFELRRTGVEPGLREGGFDGSSDRWTLTVDDGPDPSLGRARLEITKAGGGGAAGGRVETLLPRTRRP